MREGVGRGERMRCRRKEGPVISQISSEKELLGCFFFSGFLPLQITVVS